MNLQYLHDVSGKTTGVFIPIKVWNKLREKYHDIEIEEVSELQNWQKDIIDERLEMITNGNEEFLDFEKTTDEIEKEL